MKLARSMKVEGAADAVGMAEEVVAVDAAATAVEVVAAGAEAMAEEAVVVDAAAMVAAGAIDSFLFLSFWFFSQMGADAIRPQKFPLQISFRFQAR